MASGWNENGTSSNQAITITKKTSYFWNATINKSAADSTSYNHFNSYAIITFNFKAHSTLKSIQFLKVSEIS